MWQYNEKTIKEGKAWTDNNGIQHPSNWHIWSREEKEAIGLVEIIPQTPPDSRLYIWSQNPDGTITSKAKKLDDTDEVDENGDPLLDEKGKQVVTLGLKSQLILQVKEQQGSLLSQTDWAIIRKTDTNINIPSNIQVWRNEIRLAAAAMEDSITQAVDIDDVANLFVTYILNDDGTTSKSGILFDWPELEE